MISTISGLLPPRTQPQNTPSGCGAVHADYGTLTNLSETHVSHLYKGGCCFKSQGNYED